MLGGFEPTKGISDLPSLQQSLLASHLDWPLMKKHGVFSRKSLKT
jgi:hypothetical protein